MVNKRALKYSWKITDEVNPLLISKNRTLLHSHRHPCQLCLPACLSKIIGRVSTASCLFIWFPEGDGCLPMPYCLEIPPRHLYSSAPPSGHNASGRCWLEVSHCALPREQKQPHSCERGKAFTAPPPPPRVVRLPPSPEDPSHCDSSHSRTRWHLWASLVLHFLSKRETRSGLQRCLFST